MLASIALAVVTLRLGLALRRARRSRLRRSGAAVMRHVRIARPTVAMLLAGFAAGPISAVWLRGWDAFSTAHAWVALLAITLFSATAVLGHRLHRGLGRPVEAHALLGLLAVLAAAAALGTGFVLLP